MISKKFSKIMRIIKSMMMIETFSLIYILKCLADYSANPILAFNGLIRISQLPSIFEHILMSVAITVGGALLFTILEKRGELT